MTQFYEQPLQMSTKESATIDFLFAVKLPKKYFKCLFKFLAVFRAKNRGGCHEGFIALAVYRRKFKSLPESKKTG